MCVCVWGGGGVRERDRERESLSQPSAQLDCLQKKRQHEKKNEGGPAKRKGSTAHRGGLRRDRRVECEINVYMKSKRLVAC